MWICRKGPIMRDLTTGNILTDWQEHHVRLFGRHSLKLKHSLHKSDLFTDEALAKLIENYPRDLYHVKTTDTGAATGRSHREGELGGISGEAALEAVRKGQIWINLQNPGAIEPGHADMLTEMYREFEARVPGLKTFKHMSTILISSPHVKVRYHADVPGQMLWQVRGKKRVWVYPNSAPFLPDEAIEKLTLKRFHETDMPYEPWFDDYADVLELEPGYMLYWPLNCPHRVENHDSLNISITTEHWSAPLRDAYAMNYANGLLRSAGLSSLSTAPLGARYYAKLALAAAHKLSGAGKSKAKPYHIDFAVDPGSPTGYRDIHAYEFRK